MGGLQKHLCGLSLGLWGFATALPACAQDARPIDPLPMFAACTGRLSALMEFQWLTQDPGADRTQVLRDAMADLLEVVTPPEARVRAMSLRIEAKAAAAVVLRQARFSRDAVLARWAQVRAARLVADCAGLLIRFQCSSNDHFSSPDAKYEICP